MYNCSQYSRFLLSDAYVSLVSHRPSLTALHVLRTTDALLGYVGANFDLRHLPMTAGLYDDPAHWLQVKGDPSIRSTVFLQTRSENPMDPTILDTALARGWRDGRRLEIRETGLDDEVSQRAGFTRSMNC